MSLGIGIPDDKEEKMPSYSREEVEQIIKNELDHFRDPRIKPGFTWKGEHTFELTDYPLRSVMFGLHPYGKLPAHLQPEPSATTTTTTSTILVDDGLPYTMKSGQPGEIEDFPAITPNAEPGAEEIKSSLPTGYQPDVLLDQMIINNITKNDQYVIKDALPWQTNKTATTTTTTTTAETKADVSMTIREAPTFNLGYPDSDDDSIPELIAVEPEPVTTTATTTSEPVKDTYSRLVYDSSLNEFKRELIKAVPTETKAEVSTVIHAPPAFNPDDSDSDEDSVPELVDIIPDDEKPRALVDSSDDESKPNTTATTVTTTSSATADTNPSLLMCRREGTKNEALFRELQEAAPDMIIFSSNMLQYLKANDLPARFEDPVSGGVGAPVATTVVVASTPTETKASETEDFYAALDKERSAWKQGPPAPWSRWHFDAHLLRPTPTPQDEEAMRKVGLPPLGWMCTTCSRYFDYPSTVCAHAWRPVWSGGGGPTCIEEVD